MSHPASYRLSFGDFEADLVTGELRRGSTRIKLAAQAFRLLVLLAEQSGELVTRDQIRAELWPHETVVEWEHSVNTAVNRIRAALNDSSTNPRYLETLPRRGYRFISTVTRIESKPQSQEAPRTSPPFTPPRNWDDPVGRTIAHYKIAREIGRGGMGVVYQAEDVNLGRDVALKFVSAELSSDPLAFERLRREAQTASLINHPAICTIFEIEQEDGTGFIAMELLDGENLHDRLNRSPRTPTTTVLDWGIAVAGALVAAHERGIIHRDIKPGNIIIGTRGNIKVVDFGLAKSANRPIGSNPLTVTGVIPGSLAYMSPEQAAGEELGARSDLYSLGAVLFEAAAGKRPDRGQIRALPAEIRASRPARLWEILERLLEHDPGLRYQSAADVESELKRLKRDIESGMDPAIAPSVIAAAVIAEAGDGRNSKARRSFLVLAAVGALGCLAAVVVAYVAWRERLPDRMTMQPLTGMGGQEDDPAFDPEGKLVAYSSQLDGSGFKHLFVKLIGGGPPIQLTSGPVEDNSPDWSPDGRTIAFFRSVPMAGAQLCLIPALGGEIRVLGEIKPQAPDSGSRVMSWMPNSVDLLVSDRAGSGNPPAIFQVSANTGNRKKLTKPPPGSDGDGSPAVSPDGQRFAFIRWAKNSVGDIFVQNWGGDNPQRLTVDGNRISSLAWGGDGRTIIFQSARGSSPGLWRIPAGGGSPRPLEGIGVHAINPAATRAGRLAYVYQAESANLWRIPGPTSRTAAAPLNLTSSPGEDISGEYSPDGKRLVFSSDRSGSFQIWVASSDGSHPRQLTFLRSPITGTPHWSPDGRQIAFDSRPEGRGAVFVIDSQGGDPRQVTQDEFDDIVPNWSQDGNSLYFCSNRGNAGQIFRIPASGGTVVQITKDGGFEAVESADRQWLYFSKSNAGGVWKMPLPGGKEDRVLDLFVARFWTVTPSGIGFLDLNAKPRPIFGVMNVATRKVKTLGTLRGGIAWGNSGLSISPGGEWLLYAQVDGLISQIFLVENFE